MKTFLKIAFISLIAFSCNKDESSLNDYDLWGRLASKSGTWAVESLTTKDHTIANSNSIDLAPKFEFIQFFLRTYLIGGLNVEEHTANFYVGESYSRSVCEAEEQRVVFHDNQLYGGEVWTLKENKKNKQVWTFTTGNNTATLTLKRCNCEIPKVPGNESAG